MPEQPALVGTTRNPVPHGAVTGYFRTGDNLSIRFARWGATAAERRGTICLFQGRTEYIEKYFETIADLRRRGFAVAAMDWRGQGGSSRLLKNPAKGHADSFASHDQDVRTFMTEIVLPDSPPPYFALAHSMGGHLVLRLAQSKACWWDRIILSAPMVHFAGSQGSNTVRCVVATAAALAGLGSAFIPGGKPESWQANSFEGNRLTSDRLRYERAQEVLQAAPELGIGSPTLGWVAAACRSVAYITSAKFLESVKVPVLILAAGNDQIVSTPATEEFASRVKNCRCIVIAGAQHEILQERDELRDQFWAAFDEYVPGSSSLTQGSGANPPR